MVRVTASSGLLGWAALVGLSLGFGAWMLVSLTPRMSRPSLAIRVAPYVADVSPAARDLLSRRTADPLPIFGAMFGPVVSRLRGLLAAVLGGTETLARRLRQSGSAMSIEAFRSRQLSWAIVGLLIGIVVAIGAARNYAVPLAGQAAIVAFATIGGVWLPDAILQRAAASRLRRMGEEFPTIVEFLTLSLSAGEGILDAVRRVSRLSSGELAVELRGVVASVNTGVPFATALEQVAADLRLPPLTRLVEQLVGALERGTPLSEVLRAQAQDSRDQARRDLLEAAGKKEVAMLVPLIFLILPTTIVFAIFPGILVLQLGL